MEYILKLSFLCTDNQKSYITLEGVKPLITDNEVNSLMQSIIDNNIFFNKHGRLLTKESAELTQREIKDFILTI